MLEKSQSLIQHTARLRIGVYIPYYYINNGLTHGKAGPVDIFGKILVYAIRCRNSTLTSTKY